MTSAPNPFAESFLETEHRFAAYLRNPRKSSPPADIEARRLKIYTDLFYNNIEGFIRRGFPVIRKIMDDSRWHSMVGDFFHRHACDTPYFHEICQEFLQYLHDERSTAPQACQDPGFLYELAHYECVELMLSIDETDVDFQGVDPSIVRIDRWELSRIQRSPLAWLQTYRYPVHQIALDALPERPLAEPIFLMVYRNRDDRVKFMHLNGFSARFMQLLDDSSLENTQAVMAQLARESGASVERLSEPGQALMSKLLALDILI